MKRKGGEIQVTEKICVIIALLALVVAVITNIKELMILNCGVGEDF